MPKIAIVGGGAKAAAIAAKAYALRQTGCSPPDIDIYERNDIGAAWSGRAGYTDGLQLLCTAAERDIGYPHDRAPWGRETARFMFQRFSWSAFVVSNGRRANEYDHWVLRGRSPPHHAQFTSYLQSAVALSGAQVHCPNEVTELDHDGRQWQVTAQGIPGRQSYDGVVITGSGDPLQPFANANQPNIFDAKSFWQSLPTVAGLLQADPNPCVAIIGAGGAAAAIAYWFVRAGMQAIPIWILGREATLFARYPNRSEDRLFTDGPSWSRLADHVKDAFIARATRGVVSDAVLRGLEAANIFYRCCEVDSFALSSLPGVPPAIEAVLRDPPDPVERIVQRRIQEFLVQNGITGITPPAPAPAPLIGRLRATVFIDARGFDPWWFVDLFQSPRWIGMFDDREAIRANIDYSLAASGRFPGGLHVPALASRQSPAAPNLMALGWMSDRVLRAYVPPAPTTSGVSKLLID